MYIHYLYGEWKLTNHLPAHHWFNLEVHIPLLGVLWVSLDKETGREIIEYYLSHVYFISSNKHTRCTQFWQSCPQNQHRFIKSKHSKCLNSINMYIATKQIDTDITGTHDVIRCYENTRDLFWRITSHRLLVDRRRQRSKVGESVGAKLPRGAQHTLRGGGCWCCLLVLSPRLLWAHCVCVVCVCVCVCVAPAGLPLSLAVRWESRGAGGRRGGGARGRCRPVTSAWARRWKIKWRFFTSN